MLDNLVFPVIVAVVLAIGGWLLTRLREAKDRKNILRFMQGSAASTEYTFRATAAIAANAKLTEERVEQLCTKMREVTRNGAEKQSWRLATPEELASR